MNITRKCPWCGVASNDGNLYDDAGVCVFCASRVLQITRTERKSRVENAIIREESKNKADGIQTEVETRLTSDDFPDCSKCGGKMGSGWKSDDGIYTCKTCVDKCLQTDSELKKPNGVNNER